MREGEKHFIKLPTNAIYGKKLHVPRREAVINMLDMRLTIVKPALGGT